MIAGAVEYDDRPGPQRDAMVAIITGWKAELLKAIRQAVAEGHLKRNGRRAADGVRDLRTDAGHAPGRAPAALGRQCQARTRRTAPLRRPRRSVEVSPRLVRAPRVEAGRPASRSQPHPETVQKCRDPTCTVALTRSQGVTCHPTKRHYAISSSCCTKSSVRSTNSRRCRVTPTSMFETVNQVVEEAGKFCEECCCRPIGRRHRGLHL